MKKIVFYFCLLLPFFGYVQGTNIYTKWYTILNDKTELILDLSNGYHIGVTKIMASDEKNYWIDSFGYKRRFETLFIDLDSTTIFWSGSMARLHPSIETEYRVGMIQTIEKNYRGVPQKIKFSGDLPDLGIYLEDQDTIIFNRMVTAYEDEIEYHYSTHYGGKISYIRYLGENPGFSMGISGVGFQFRPVKLDKLITKKISNQVVEKINTLRRDMGSDTLNHDLALDTASHQNLTLWMNAANEQHRLEIDPEFSNPSGYDSSSFLTLPNKLNVIYYPFQCGENATAIRIQGENISSINDLRKHVSNHYQDYIESLVPAWQKNKGISQNIYNSGYAGLGSSLVLYEAFYNDFYFDHKGKIIKLLENDVKYYFLILSQKFSAYDKQ